jgi:hypothetical protein
MQSNQIIVTSAGNAKRGNGQWSVVSGQLSVVSWSLVFGSRPYALGFEEHGTKVKGQRPKTKDQLTTDN